MAAELRALVNAIDHAYMVRETLEKLPGDHIALGAFVNKRTLFNVTAKDSGTAEQRLQIDICPLRKSYRKGELKRLGRKPGKENAANALSKEIIKKDQ